MSAEAVAHLEQFYDFRDANDGWRRKRTEEGDPLYRPYFGSLELEIHDRDGSWDSCACGSEPQFIHPANLPWTEQDDRMWMRDAVAGSCARTDMYLDEHHKYRHFYSPNNQTFWKENGGI